MPKVTVTETVEAPVDLVWSAWDDYGGIMRFNPNISKSFLINKSAASGLGAERQCDLADGKNFIQERVIDYVPNRRMRVDIFNGTLPLKTAVLDIRLTPLGPARTRVDFTMAFTPKMGPLGQLMVPLMKPQFRKLLGKLLEGNKAYVERGETVARAA